MKIMHLCTGFPISFSGGITNYVRSLAIEQSNEGHDVSVVSEIDKKGNDYNFKYIGYKDFYIKPFSFRSKKCFFAYKRIERIIKKEKPDLIHIHMVLDVDRRLYKILSKYNIKYIVSLHDYSFLCPRIQMFKNDKLCGKVGPNCAKCATRIEQTFFTNKIFKILKIDRTKGKEKSPEFLKIYEDNKKTLENANLLLPVSKRVQEIYEESGINNNYKVMHIGNITANYFKKYKKQKRDKNDKIKLLMLGNFSKIKGGLEFIKIANALVDSKKFEFYFLGRCTKEEKKSMKDNNIIYKGSYVQTDLPKILKGYDLGCVLSIWEDNGPQVVMELLNNNVPVIGTKMGGIPDFIQDSKNGFLYDPYKEKSFNDLINKLKRISVEEIEEMKSNIKPTITPKEHFDQINQVYNDVIGGKYEKV